QVLLKSDGFPTYHLANVVDDHLMLITHVIRAEEWISSTPKHILLYEAFGWDKPGFIHMPLLRNADKSKISKRKNPVSLKWYRDEGYLPEALLNFLGNMGYSFVDGGGEAREIFTLQEMIADFSWDRVGKTGPIFDFTKLDWMNGVYIRNLSVDQLADRLLSTVLKDAQVKRDYLLKIVPLIQERIAKLNREQFDAMADFFFVKAADMQYDPALLVPKKQTAESTAAALQKAHAALAQVSVWEAPAMEEKLRAVCDEIGWKASDLFMAIRIAVTGKKASPPLLESMVVLGRDESLARIKRATGLL
ncbi:MAG TPA: glutamate--tRNA ligase family protein, partial [Planctomycetota bacterium]|nr:glutamate--tRNA ligase family protein [Planctomycetota bacterium]